MYRGLQPKEHSLNFIMMFLSLFWLSGFLFYVGADLSPCKPTHMIKIKVQYSHRQTSRITSSVASLYLLSFYYSSFKLSYDEGVFIDERVSLKFLAFSEQFDGFNLQISCC